MYCMLSWPGSVIINSNLISKLTIKLFAVENEHILQTANIIVSTVHRK